MKEGIENINVRLFPEVAEVRNLVNDDDFIERCSGYVTGEGYSTRLIGEDICIFLDGQSSCHSGTLVGWKYVSDIEKFVKSNVSDWCFSSERNQKEISAVFAAVSEVATKVSKNLLNEK
jgi:hypothetical protein